MIKELLLIILSYQLGWSLGYVFKNQIKYICATLKECFVYEGLDLKNGIIPLFKEMLK